MLASVFFFFVGGAACSASWVGVEMPVQGSPLRFLLVAGSMGWPEPCFALPETALPTAKVLLPIIGI